MPVDPSAVACAFSIGSFCLLARSAPPAPICGCQCDCGSPGWSTAQLLAVAAGQLVTGWFAARWWAPPRPASPLVVAAGLEGIKQLTLPAGARGRLEGGAPPRFWALFDASEGVWHERLVLRRTVGGHVVLTPDGDVYEELLEDYEAALPSGVAGGIPSRLYGPKIFRYAFRPGDIAHGSAFRRRAEAYLAGWAGAPPAAEGGGRVPAPLADAGAMSAPARGSLVPAADVDPGFYDPGALVAHACLVGSEWFVGENQGPRRRGESITIRPSDLAFGVAGQALLCREGVWYRLCRDPPTPLPAGEGEAAAAEDLRTLAVEYNVRGERTRSFESARHLLREEVLDDAWPVEGPRTVQWLIEAFAHSGMAPVPRHHWWRQALGATTSDPGIDEHLFLSECIQHGLQYDQLNICNLACFESMARRYQLWEERYQERIRASTEGSVAAGLAAERHLFLGGDRAKGYALISPELERWVAKRMEEQAAVLKERRKGREERALAAAATGGGGGGGGAGQPLGADHKKKLKDNKKGKDWQTGTPGAGLAADPRDLLPLPAPTSPVLRQGDALGLEWFSAGLQTLNEMGGRGAVRRTGAASGPQTDALERLRSSYATVPSCPSDLTADSATRAVIGSDPGYGFDDMASGKYASYQRGKVSLPRVASGAVELAAALPEGPRSLLMGESGTLLMRGSTSSSSLAKLAFDRRLASNPRTYGKFLADLLERDMLEVGTSFSQVAPFFVYKKDGALRLIFDTRASNTEFAEPDYVPLAAAQALGNIELQAGGRLFVAQGDVTCCFYQFLLPVHLREAFGLPPVPWAALPLAARRLVGAPPPDGLVRLRLRVVPMGWSWAVYFIQHAMMEILRPCAPADRWLAQYVPREPVCPGSGTSLIYIDNFAALGTSPTEANARLEQMLGAVAAAGVDAAPEPAGAPLLGFELDPTGTQWRPTARKFWKVALALRTLGWGRQRRTGRQIARAVGHASAIMLLRPEMLSIFSAVYVFADRYFGQPARVWASVRRELRAAWALLPLAVADMSLPWSPAVASVDASLHGFGVTEKAWPPAEVGRVGRASERGRYRGALRTSRRPRCLVEGEEAEPSLSDIVDASPEQLRALGLRSAFEEVPSALARGDDWGVVAARRWRRKDKILALEAEAALWQVRRLARSRLSAQKRHLVLSDSMAWVLTSCKGRSSSWYLLRRCREFCAMCLALADVDRGHQPPPRLEDDCGDSPFAQPIALAEARLHGPAGAAGLREQLAAGRSKRRAFAGPFAAGLPGPEPAALQGAGASGEPESEPGPACPKSGAAPSGGAGPAPASGRLPCRTLAAAGPLGLARQPAPGRLVPYRGESGSARRLRRETARRRPGSSLHSAARSAEEAEELGFHISSLAAAAVTTATQSNYLNALRKLLAWLHVPRAPQRLPASEWDLLLEQYVEFLHDRGLPEGDASSTLAAVRWALPELPRPLRRGLPLATAAVTGWRRLEKPLSRPPVPRSLAVLMALRLCSDGKADYALFLLLTFETYMRPSEALSLVGLQLVPPVPNERGACQFWTILIRASELDVLGKTGEFDTSVALDLPRHRLLESALRLLKANRGERERLFLFHYTDFLLAWNSCLLGLGLAQLKVTPYSLHATMLKHSVFVDLFAGTAPVSKYLRRKGYACIAFDKLQGPQFDLGRREVVLTIAGWLRAGLVWALWFATPCITTTRARTDRSGRMPPPLRSSEHYRGLPDLSASHRAQVREANSLIDSGGRLQQLAWDLGICCGEASGRTQPPQEMSLEIFNGVSGEFRGHLFTNGCLAYLCGAKDLTDRSKDTQAVLWISGLISQNPNNHPAWKAAYEAALPAGCLVEYLRPSDAVNPTAWTCEGADGLEQSIAGIWAWTVYAPSLGEMKQALDALFYQAMGIGQPGVPGHFEAPSATAKYLKRQNTSSSGAWTTNHVVNLTPAGRVDDVFAKWLLDLVKELTFLTARGNFAASDVQAFVVAFPGARGASDEAAVLAALVEPERSTVDSGRSFAEMAAAPGGATAGEVAGVSSGVAPAAPATRLDTVPASPTSMAVSASGDGAPRAPTAGGGAPECPAAKAPAPAPPSAAAAAEPVATAPVTVAAADYLKAATEFVAAEAKKAAEVSAISKFRMHKDIQQDIAGTLKKLTEMVGVGAEKVSSAQVPWSPQSFPVDRLEWTQRLTAIQEVVASAAAAATVAPVGAAPKMLAKLGRLKDMDTVDMLEPRLDGLDALLVLARDAPHTEDLLRALVPLETVESASDLDLAVLAAAAAAIPFGEPAEKKSRTS
ncbi:unnamed protein product [Prorocentrum cordatum]|uniref:Uncharacterized protein n=1 Tax=Prorocentrum cordatum TaxID=2364126 RepID=A0ABN9VSE4_9DINO|nr:unnamed protein product [Polarella glacialis]